MKRTLLSLWVMFALTFVSGIATAQNYLVLTNPNLTDTEGGLVDANGLSENQQARFNITILNLDDKQAVKSGSCEIKIELGEKMKFPEGASLAKVAYNQYFAWTLAKDSKGTNCMFGKLTHDLPAGFEGVASFDLQCVGTGSSMLKTQCISNAQRANKSALNSVVFTIIPKASSRGKN